MKIEILTERYHIAKLQSLLEWLRPRASITLTMTDSAVLDTRSERGDCDLVFVKGQSDLLLGLARLRADRGLRVVNCPDAIWASTNRHLHCLLAERAGVLVPPVMLGVADACDFDPRVVKNVFDQRHVRFRELLPIVADRSYAIPAIPAAAEAGGPETEEHHVFQKVINSRYEYKVYGVGDEFFFQRRVPMLPNVERHTTRERLDENPTLAGAARAVMAAIGLDIASIDFLEEDGAFYFIDINATPNFAEIADLVPRVGSYLLDQPVA